MKRQLLSGNGKRALISMLICCMWVCALPAAVKAQAKFSSVTCSVRTVKSGLKVNLQLKGTAQVTGLNPQNAQTKLIYLFQTRAAGVQKWDDMPNDGSITTAGVNGTANFDTGWITFDTNGPPNQGQQFRTVVSASYTDANGKLVQILVQNSDPVTYNP